MTTAFGDQGADQAPGRGSAPAEWIGRNPVAALVIAVAIILALWLVLAPWPAGFEDVFGKKRLFINALFNGITLGGLYFLVATGFTLIFGLMRNVNLAHGSLYLFGGYIGYAISTCTGSWVLGFIVAFLGVALLGVVLQIVVFRRMEGQDLRQTMVTIGLSIVIADLLIWIFTAQVHQMDPPALLAQPFRGLPLINAYSSYRMMLLPLGIVIGVLLWLFLNRTRVGMMIRAGVDDRGMLSASGVNVNLVFAITFAIGAGLAGFGGVIGAVELSMVPARTPAFCSRR